MWFRGYFLVSLAVHIAAGADAQTPRKTWDPDGVPVTQAPGPQGPFRAVPSLTGSAIVLWTDARNGADETDIFGERIDSRGLGQWRVDGAPVSSVPFRESNVAVTTDGAGGVIAVWEDTHDLKSNIYAQRLGPDGVALWNENGVPISTKCWPPPGVCGNAKGFPDVVGDGSGGAYFAWEELRDGFHISIWAQHVDASGAILWETDGIPIAEGDFHVRVPRLASDGEGGAIIVWADARDILFRAYTQRYDGDGAPRWAPGGILLSPFAGGLVYESISLLADGTGGAFFAFVDGRVDFNDSNLYAQRIDGSGVTRWTQDGVALCTLPRHQTSPVLVSDGASGVIVAWEDQSDDRRIAAQRLSPLGEALWADQGISVSTQGESFPDLVSDEGRVPSWYGTVIEYETKWSKGRVSLRSVSARTVSLYGARGASKSIISPETATCTARARSRMEPGESSSTGDAPKVRKTVA